MTNLHTPPPALSHLALGGFWQDNAEYSFLFDGAGSAFYRWALYCKLYGLPMDQKPPQQQQAQQQPSNSAAAPEAEALPPDVQSGFSQVLAALTGSKVMPTCFDGTDTLHDQTLMWAGLLNP